MFRTSIALITFCASICVCGIGFCADSPPLKCESGPVNKTFGKNQWLVYGCADGRSIVVVSAPGNPAMPFYFMLYPGKDGYEVVGEGTGKKSATSAAYTELEALSESQIQTLIAEIRHSKK